MQLILQLEYVCVQKLQRPVVPVPACDLLISHGSHPANTFHSVFFPWVSPWHKVTHFLWNGNLGSSGVYPLFKRLSNYPLSPFKPPVKLFESASAKFLSTFQKELSAAGAALKPHHGRVGGPEPRAVRSACSQVACRPGSDQSHFCQCPCAREHVPQLVELSEPRSLQEHLSPIINSQSDQNRYSLKMHALQMFLTACPVYGVSFCFVTHLSCFMMFILYWKTYSGVSRHLTWKFNSTDVTLPQNICWKTQPPWLFFLDNDIRASYLFCFSLSAEESKELREGGGVWVLFCTLLRINGWNATGSWISAGNVDGCSQSQ